MSDEEYDDEDAGGFGSDAFEEYSEDEDETGFGMADEEDDDDEDGDGFGDAFGGADEDNDDGDGADGGGSNGSSEAPRKAAGAWESYASSHLNSGCVHVYEHPGVDRLWDKHVSQIPGPLDQVAAPPLYKTLLRFMGDLEPDPSKKLTAFETIQFLCAAGMKSDIMCAELYMQLLKQLCENKSKMSHARGIILLNMYLGCFPPPAEMINAVLDTIEQGPPMYREFCEDRLANSQGCPPRVRPPLRAELHAVKTRTQLQLPVYVAGSTEPRHVAVDPLVTGSGLLVQAAAVVGLASHEGWGVRIKSGQSIISIGDSKMYALDVVAEVEENGGAGKWKFELFKESFGDWHPDVSNDLMAMDLITKQISSAIHDAKFRFQNAEDVIPVVALGYYCVVQNDALMGKELEQYVSTALPKNIVLASSSAENKRASMKKASYAKKVGHWASAVEKAHAKLPAARNDVPIHVAQQELIDEIKKIWPHFFAATFEGKHVAGPGFRGIDKVFISFNEQGVYVGAFGTATLIKSFPHDEIETFSSPAKQQFSFKTAVIEGYRSQPQTFVFELQRGGDAECAAKLAQRFKVNFKQ